ncbi:sensor domain-containing diguanylate cyclase [Halodesulfovibrio marinisediminis]|uniref:PAS domain S-box-containing protein/diguanylate cyclase (GGDEF) domain-containing protein n=1 Tax=Halodesulfovibrio marinisediminis DSM 17456 TaxID=1121457 RepID=A0A1N6HFN6_9BACT|nr:sensor domain-containing diguanylate cyclase [Halodesulfovibrio marinisediminis]SIO18582.1 PAS domain S-box-containing protein/diguanylate cyclase (GGDEF) domain-containing protein [Halodesulfovibrio marinisediminis DSM 17456]
MPYVDNPFFFILLLIIYTGAVIFLAYLFLLRKKPRCICALLWEKFITLRDVKRFSSKFRSTLYSSNAIIAIRFNIHTNNIIAINETGARLLSITKTHDSFDQKITHKDFLSKESLDGLIKELDQHKRVENYPAICTIDNSVHKILITAEKYDNGDIEAMIIDITKHFNIYQQIEDQNIFLQNILNALPVPVFVCDKTRQYPFTNKAFNKHFGNVHSDSFKKYEFLTTPLFKPHRGQESGCSQFHANSLPKFHTEFATSIDGQFHHFEVQRRPLRTNNGHLFGMVGVATDITHRKRIEQDLRDTTKRYKNLFWNAAEGITTVQKDGRLTEANPAMATICGYDSPEQLLEEVPFVEKLWRFPEQRAEYVQIVLENKTAIGYDFEFIRRDGTLGWMTISSNGKFDEHGNLEYTENIISDITQKKQSEIELTRSATIDSTTGINNRHALENHLASLLSATPATPFAVVFIDLNNFKPINDTHGHYTGDRVLEVIAHRLVANCRKSDFTARLGGDEFIVVLSGVDNKHTLHNITEVLLSAIEEPIILGDFTHIISASAGVSQYPHDGETIIDLLKAADASMYEMKRSSKASKINEQLQLLANS